MLGAKAEAVNLVSVRPRRGRLPRAGRAAARRGCYRAIDRADTGLKFGSIRDTMPATRIGEEAIWYETMRASRPDAPDLRDDQRRMTRRRDYRVPRLAANLAPILASAVLGGCAVRGAPSFALFGAFFPAWMACAGVGAVAAIGFRLAFVGLGWSTRLPYQLMLCSALGLIAGILAWYLWFGQ